MIWTEKPDSFLIDFKGGDHMVFAGRHRSDRGELDATIQRLTERATTAFWDAYLRESGPAKEWLVEGGFAKELGSNGVMEIKIENHKE